MVDFHRPGHIYVFTWLLNAVTFFMARGVTRSRQFKTYHYLILEDNVYTHNFEIDQVWLLFKVWHLTVSTYCKITIASWRE